MGVSRKIVGTAAIDARIGTPVQNVTALRAVIATNRADKQIRLTEDSEAIFYFDTSSMAVDNGVDIIKPTDVLITNPGRWLKVESKAISRSDIINVVSNGQTAFILPYLPAASSSVEMIPIGGVEQQNGVDFTVSGVNITYSGSVPFAMGEKIIFRYDTYEL